MIRRIILVVGLPGSGKTHYVKQNLGNGIVYDLDYIAAALRLSDPHSLRHEAARVVTNELLFDFITKAKLYSENIYVIRSAPSVFEVKQISPSKIVICKGSYNIMNRPDYVPVDRCDYLNKIQRIINLAKEKNIPLIEIKN